MNPSSSFGPRKREPGGPKGRGPRDAPGRASDRGRGPCGPRHGGTKSPPRPGGPAGGWDHVAAWYDRLVGDEGSDYHQQVILPAAMRLLDPQPSERILDLCAGQGVLARLLAAAGVAEVVAVDASPRLIDAARRRHPGNAPIRYVVRDATRLGDVADGRFDAAACIMAVQDVPDLSGLFGGIARALRPGGRAVVLLMHPCFRVPRQSSWEWDEAKRTQYRRIDRYATPIEVPIATHPGRDPGTHTVFYHRPLAEILNALAAGELALDRCEELLSHRVSAPGGHSRGENRAAREIPVFLALRGRKRNP